MLGFSCSWPSLILIMIVRLVQANLVLGDYVITKFLEKRRSCHQSK